MCWTGEEMFLQSNEFISSLYTAHSSSLQLHIGNEQRASVALTLYSQLICFFVSCGPSSCLDSGSLGNVTAHINSLLLFIHTDGALYQSISPHIRFLLRSDCQISACILTLWHFTVAQSLHTHPPVSSSGISAAALQGPCSRKELIRDQRERDNLTMSHYESYVVDYRLIVCTI